MALDEVLVQKNEKYIATLKIKHAGLLTILKGDHEPPFRGVLTGAEAETKLSCPQRPDFELFSLTSRQPPLALEGLPDKRFVVIGNEPPLLVTNVSAYPAEYASELQLRHCPYCLDHMANIVSFERHTRKCDVRLPPGREIYRIDNLRLFQVNGYEAVAYCRNLCLLGKAFINSKALFHDVEAFLFYVLVRESERGEPTLVGYFSKPKHRQTSSGLGENSGVSEQQIRVRDLHNLSCIVVLPRAENRGLGQFLISVSYLLSRLEGLTGTPERPLSRLGLKSYQRYWTRTIAKELKKAIVDQTKLSVRILSEATGMTLNDVIYCLEHMGMFKSGKVEIDISRLVGLLNRHNGPILEANLNLLKWEPYSYTN